MSFDVDTVTEPTFEQLVKALRAADEEFRLAEEALDTARERAKAAQTHLYEVSDRRLKAHEALLRAAYGRGRDGPSEAP